MNDRSTVKLVVTLLGVIALGALAGLVYLAGEEKLTDALTTGLFGTATACVGVIGGLLARTDSIDVAGLDELKAAADESFLPVIADKLAAARSEGAQSALDSLRGPAEPMRRAGVPLADVADELGLAAPADDAGDLDDEFDPGPAVADELELAIPPPRG